MSPNPTRPLSDTLSIQEDWQPIETAPFQTVVEVRNPQMSRPCLATRGYMTDIGVHPDDTFCTSVFTPDPDGFFPTPSGHLVCPTEWREAVLSDSPVEGRV